VDRAGHGARAPAADGSRRPPRHRGSAQNPRPPQPHSFALAEAFLAPLHATGLPDRQAALAYRLIYDYILGFSLSDRASPGEQRVQDTAARAELHAFLRSLPASRFPALSAFGAYAWADDRDERFTAACLQERQVAGVRGYAGAVDAQHRRDVTGTSIAYQWHLSRWRTQSCTRDRGQEPRNCP
jgi:tetracycline repressor-like protein